MDKDVVTTEERYGRAISSSDLRVSDAAGDVDALIAAGWLPNDLGPLLYRLRVELDSLLGDQVRIKRHRAELQPAIKVSRALVQREMRYGPSPAAADLYVLLSRQQLLDREEAAARLSAVQQLRTLPEARDVLGRWADIEATRFITRSVLPHPLKLKSMRARVEWDMLNGPSLLAGELVAMEERRARALEQAAHNSTLTPPAVRLLTSGLLQTFMNPICQSCCGRGRTDGHGKPEVACRACHGTGRAREALGRTDEQRDFCAHALTEMERLCDAVSRTMQYRLRNRNLRG
jgi:hypothetical protein